MSHLASIRKAGLVFAVALGLLVVGAYALPPADLEAANPGRENGERGAVEVAAPTDYELTVARLERQIDISQRFADAQPDGWLRRSDLASLLLGHARLTGDLASYDRAGAVLREAFSHAANGSGPLLPRASYLSSMHRFDEARSDLEAIRPHGLHPPPMMAEVRGLLGDIDLARGDYANALANYEAALTLHRSSSGVSRLANYFALTGEPRRAHERYEEAAEMLSPNDGRGRAWVALQRGLLELAAGDYDAALRHYEESDRAFSGWWLVEEHIAEVLAATDRREEAASLYEAVVTCTDDPELMSAYARVLRELGRNGAGDTWEALATAGFEARLDTHPEAAAGHAINHFTEIAGEEEHALALARRNAERRPGGEAKTLLALTLARTGQLPEARQVIEEVLATPFRAAATHALASAIYASHQEPEAASEQLRLARELNPHVALPELASP